MARFFHPLVRILANATQREMVRQIEYLKTENEILRSKLPKRITVTPAERARLVKVGRKVGAAIKNLITIVSPQTFRRWVNGEKRPKRSIKRGRPRTPEEIRELIIRIAKETGLGYTRILGELKKLGIHKISRTTVINILKAEGLDPGPKRGKGSWDEFLKIHAKTLWACDFLSKKVWTKFGRVEMYVLFFIHLESRRVFVTPPTAHPNEAWVQQQARNIIMHVEDQGEKVEHLLHDYDTKFTASFDAIMETEGAVIHKVGPQKPNLNAYIERFIQTIQVECLDHFVVLGEKHLSYLVNEYVDFYNTQRSGDN